MHGLAEALERLRSPFATEELAAFGGEGVLVVDLDADAPAPSGGGLAAARIALAELACPSLGIRREGTRPGALDGCFDVVVAEPAELTPVLDAVRGCPLASLALVQLLRHGVALDLHEALVAESLVYSTLQAGPEFGAWWRERPEPRPRRPNLAPAVLVERSGPRLSLRLNRPEKRNAFSKEMRDGLVEALRVARVDPSLEEIVLRGAGPSFCSGGDLDEFGTFPDPATAHAVRSARHPARWMAACAGRVRVELHGACVGAGIELPAFAARVVADPGAFFQLPEVGMGLVPGAGGTASLPRRIGRQRTAWLALSRERVDAETALAWGLVDEVAVVDGVAG